MTRAKSLTVKKQTDIFKSGSSQLTVENEDEERAGIPMVNERKTENLVRESLTKKEYYTNENLIIEEQISENPKIKKLLKHASKKGGGQGYPEFIIRSSKISDFIIVIECKADVKKHKSKKLDQYSDYSVDGALLYGSFLSKEYDVVVIGVSGETKTHLKVSHYLWLKGTNEYKEFFGDKILSFNDYHDGLMRSDIKFRQDYNSLLEYTRELNEILHGKKIKESQRSMLISGILIALQNSAFLNSYTKHNKPNQLAKNLVEVIGNELSNADIPEEKISNIKQSFSFIRSHTTLSKDKEFLKDLIHDIDNNVNYFIQTYKYFDTIGQFYIEFLRYANNDKGLGIVLTPPHITELFCELAEVNKDSVVLDNCCGTSGFLISAMKKMIRDAKSDSAKIKDIKLKQLVGIEYQDDIYALSVSNMIIHRDGKSNIHLGDCFELIEETAQKYHPNIGLLNPPYKTKKSDIEEIEFVLNNLDMLEPNGKCVSIIPISCVLADRGIGLNVKERLLGKHTLDAVLSMPSGLFHNSDVGVVTVIMVVTAHNPHPKGKKTWFGYWRDDGFEKVKGKGRIDASNRWNEIKQKWVNSYKNREVISGFSVMKEVSAKDEWCAEAYLKTDYSEIGSELFENELKKYAAYKIVN